MVTLVKVDRWARLSVCPRAAAHPAAVGAVSVDSAWRKCYPILAKVLVVSGLRVV
jgi:hypothetical protein